MLKPETITHIRAGMRHPNTAAFLRVIRAGETSQEPDAYRMMFGGGLVENLNAHPRKAITKPLGRQTITSTAAGAYQFLARTWDECAAALGLTGFSQAEQDLAAAFLIHRRKALDHVVAGRFEQAVAACAREWASLPGSPYGQPTKTMAQARAVYQTWGGRYEGDATAPTAPAAPPPAAPAQETPKEPEMLQAFALAALPTLFAEVPKLLKKFGDGTSVAERNSAAVQVALDVATAAVGARNEQELVEIIKTDPVAAQTIRNAIDENWGRIDEIGGGVVAAREANIAQSAIDPKRNLALWISLALMPLLYITVGAVLFDDGWTSDVKAMVVASIVSGLLGALTGYWLGTSFSSARKDDRMAASQPGAAP